MNPQSRPAVVQTLQDTSLDPLVLFRSEDLRIIDANSLALELAGLNREQLVGMKITDLVRAEAKALAGLFRALQSKTVFQSDQGCSLKGKRGETIPVHLVVSHVVADQGSIGLLVARDLSAPKKAEQALSKALKKEGAMGRLRDRIISVHQLSDLLELREHWLAELRGLGIPVLQTSIQQPTSEAGYFVSGKWFFRDKATLEDPIAAHSWVEEAWRTGKPVLVTHERLKREWPELGEKIQCILEVPLPGGGSLAVNSQFANAFDEEAIRTIQDFAGLVSEGLKRAEDMETIREQQKYVSDILNSMAECVIVVSPEGKIVTVNPATCATWGYESNMLLGEQAQKLLGEDFKLLEGPKLQKLIQDGSVRSVETMFRARDGRSIHALFSASVIRGPRGRIQGFVCMAYDMTERKLLEEEVRQAQKMEVIGRVAGGVAHDFNNLITIILGYCELIQSELLPSHPAHQRVSEIWKAGEQASALIGELLTFSRRRVVRPQILSINEVIRAAEAMLRRILREEIQLETRLEPGLGKVMADPGEIEQVLTNLAINARDALPLGGQVTLETANVEYQEAHGYRLGQIEPGSYVRLAVSDNGCGMNEEILSHLFEPFFTTKERGKGTGLGLTTIYGIIRRSSGHITVESKPGQGSTFRLYIPRVTDAPEKAAAPVSEPESTERGETILLAEDEEVVRRMTRDGLRMEGYHVLEAANGEEAIQVAQKFAAPIHLLLTDVVMPGMTGRELSLRLQETRPQIKVIFMTGYTREDLGHSEEMSPQLCWLQKPFARRTLLKKIRELLGGERRNI